MPACMFERWPFITRCMFVNQVSYPHMSVPFRLHSDGVNLPVKTETKKIKKSKKVKWNFFWSKSKNLDSFFLCNKLLYIYFIKGWILFYFISFHFHLILNINCLLTKVYFFYLFIWHNSSCLCSVTFTLLFFYGFICMWHLKDKLPNFCYCVVSCPVIATNPILNSLVMDKLSYVCEMCQ